MLFSKNDLINFDLMLIFFEEIGILTYFMSYFKFNMIYFKTCLFKKTDMKLFQIKLVYFKLS